MEYNYHKSVTIPNQVLPLRELLHRFTNGVPISDNLERQGSYDWSKPFDPSHMPSDFDFNVGHDANEIDITIAQSKARNIHFAPQGQSTNPVASEIDKQDDVNKSE